MRLVDIGANLTHPAFAADLGEVLARARQAGVETIIVTGTTVEESRQASALGLPFTAGVHPHHARDCGPETIPSSRPLPEIRIAWPSASAAWTSTATTRRTPTRRNGSSPSSSWACRVGKPLFLHSRDAHPRFSDILRNYKPPRAVAHCFTGTREELKAYLDLGLHIGITGWICDERRGKHLLELVKRNPRRQAVARDRRALPYAARHEASAQGATQ